MMKQQCLPLSRRSSDSRASIALHNITHTQQTNRRLMEQKLHKNVVPQNMKYKEIKRDQMAQFSSSTNVINYSPGQNVTVLLGIEWYQSVRSDDVWRLTKQPKLTAIIQSRRLSLFWRIACMDDNADAKRILLAFHPVDWKDNQDVLTSRGSAP